MCNLAGFWQYSDQPDAARVCTLLLDASVSTSGASREALFDGYFISLGIRVRASGLIGNADIQPIVSPDGRYRLVADIRVDNRGELASALDLPLAFSQGSGELSDAAIVMLAWQRWQEHCLRKIAGAFAIAVWDQQERALFLARDPAGERPLYYHAGDRCFAFASTARALLKCPGLNANLDETHLALALCGMGREHSRSWLKGVNTVEPGHFVVARSGSVSHFAYWRLEDVPDVHFARNEEYVEAFLEVFDEAVRCRLRANGNIATELSGGLDSSSVCATAARLLAAQGRSLIAFTSVPAVDLAGRYEDRYMADEGPAAAQVAQLYPNIEHRLVTSTGSNLLRELQRTHPTLDCPMANPLNHVWINLIQDESRLAGASALLNGQRGNHTISTPGMLRDFVQRGNVFSALRLARQHNRPWGPLLQGAYRATRNSLLPRILRSGKLRPHFDSRYRKVTLGESPINPALAAELHMLERYREFVLRPPGEFRAAKWRDFNYFDIGDYHHAAQNFWGIDRRDPTSDKRVLAFCLGIPMEQYVVGGINCSLIRRAMRGRLPEQTLNQPRKGLQSGDWYESLTAILPEMVVELGRIERSSLAQRILDLPRLRATLEGWPKSATQAMLDEPQYNTALTRGLACGYFLRQFEGTD